MGPHQSTIIKNAFSKPILQVNDAPKVESFSPRPSTSQTPKPPSVKLPTPQIDRLQAKVWNPNSPDSWEPEMRGYHSVEDSDYALPSDAIEQNRLNTQHFLFRAMFHGDIVCPGAKELVKQAGTKVLDVGCAKGYWLESVRKENPLSEYHGVDIAESLVTEPSVENEIMIKFGNVLEGLPYEDSTFDYVHQRLLVLGMPKDRYPDALKELIRVTKPGGWIELIEVDVMVYKAGPYSKQLSQAILGAMQARGLDCYAGTNLEWYASKVDTNISNKGIKIAHIRYNDETPVGRLSGPNGKATFLAMEDWMHKTMGITREEYRELIDNCFEEWAEYKSFWQVCTLYFQVKK